MYRRPETIAFYRKRLPHWEVRDGHYFVTIHLAGAIPAEAVHALRERSQQLQRLTGASKLRLQREIFRKMEEWLHRAESVQHLSNPNVAQTVMDAIEHRERNRIWNVHEYVIMPNHLHLFLRLTHGLLDKTLEDFKHWTATQAGKVIKKEIRRF